MWLIVNIYIYIYICAFCCRPLCGYLHGRDAPVAPSLGSSCSINWQANKSDSGGNGQRPNEAHEKADNARETGNDLEERGHHDGALQLHNTEELDQSNLAVKNPPMKSIRDGWFERCRLSLAYSSHPALPHLYKDRWRGVNQSGIVGPVRTLPLWHGQHCHGGGQQSERSSL